MSHHLIKAGINFYAILKNLEDLVALDPTCQGLIKNKSLTIQFLVKDGPKGWVKFEKNQCTVGQGRIKHPSLILWFTSPEHLNKMFDGKSNPIPLKGFTKLGFMKNEFTEITNRLAYYLKPELLENPSDEYIKINTRFTLTVAAFSLSEISKYDKKANLTASHMPNGIVQLTVLPDGPSVYLSIENGEIKATKGIHKNPDAVMEMQNYKKANDFLNGRSNSFKAIALGDVRIKGQVPLLDNLSMILSKVNKYIQ